MTVGSMAAQASRPAVSVTCHNSPDDVPNINNAILSLGAPGGVVNLAAGVCAVGIIPIVGKGNIDLVGAGPEIGGTVLRQLEFTTGSIISFNDPAGMSSVGLYDMKIDGGDFVYLKNYSVSAASANSLTLYFPGGFPSGLVAGMRIVDASNPAAVSNGATIASLSADGKSVTLSAATLAPGVQAGDEIRFYNSSGTIDAEWVAGLTIDNVHIVRSSGIASIVLQGDTNFSVTNNLVSVTHPDAEATGTILLTSRTSANPPWNHNGFISGNVVINASIEIGGTELVISNNVITPGYGTGIVAEGLDPQTGVPGSAHNIFDRNTVHFSQVGLNHDGIVAGGMEIWDTNSLISNNTIYDNGAQGILVGGPSSTIAGNVVYDNSQSPFLPNGGNSGIDIQNGANTASNEIVTGNRVCNTGKTFSFFISTSCLTTQNSGSQQNSLYIGYGVTGATLSSNNYFLPGNSNSSGVSGNYQLSSNVPYGTVSVSGCTLPNLGDVCGSSVQWSSTGATNVAVLIRSSQNPSIYQALQSGPSGMGSIPALGNNTYVVELTSDQGVLASATIQPVVGSLGADGGATAPIPEIVAAASASVVASAYSTPIQRALAVTARATAPVQSAEPPSFAASEPLDQSRAAVSAGSVIVSQTASSRLNVGTLESVLTLASGLRLSGLTAPSLYSHISHVSVLVRRPSQATAPARLSFVRYNTAGNDAANTGGLQSGSGGVKSTGETTTPIPPASLPQYSVVDAAPDSAQLIENGSAVGASLITVKVGDTVPSYGEVICITKIGESGIVITTGGTIR